ncbi:NUDIX domain-containing protein [Xenorhabdus budapestensis]|uniref:NUDIX domain-containing protein n=1 Tax=Xenorhabdus budapestensis TaxID=290110 RepID=A0ABX7VJH7_XENBU|nr:NUDIX domain-containing protein [Xenorhabdus budapestensis]QTL40733.1 NUDIX domain-containing protein [Xenorhabdus budapestensis]
MIHYVTGFMFSKDKKHVALISKLQPSWQAGKLNGIGGKVETGETPQQAMAREFAEEAGIETNPDEWKLFTILTRPDVYQVNFLYTHDDRIYSAKSIEKEVVDIYETDALPGSVIYNLRWLIPLALDEHLRFDKQIEIREIREGF